MKIPVWLKKIWTAIQKLFNHIPCELQTAVHTGVVITENIKTFVDSPAADIITAIIPGDLDDRIKSLLRSALPAILTQLRLADDCTNFSTPEQLTACAIKTIQSLKGDLKSAFLHNLSVLIAQVASDGKLTWQEAVSFMEWYYQQRFKATKQ
ncbi:hypothetical protein ABDD95_15645 [Mucilaginibacter sp. PAMB04274]|uniref:hypothetical protein n=1 Tax=Mucilaginibacter sp. PAMB04274 TaxID=3138568 RepID=UPI0031F68CAC